MQLNRQNTSIFFKLLIQIQIITQAKLELNPWTERIQLFRCFAKHLFLLHNSLKAHTND